MGDNNILGDWGTTRLRLWRIEGGEVVGVREGAGIGGLSSTPAETLRDCIAPWLASSSPDKIVLCGMAGARNGLSEARYVECPVDFSSWRDAASAQTFDGIPLRIMAGARCRERGRPDVMRGEETQVFGALALQPSLHEGRHTMALPGTHSKWVVLDQGRIAGFRTFLTGEMYGLLQQSSLLAAVGNVDFAADHDAFEAGLARSHADAGVLGSLFEARAAQLLDGHNASWAADFISGLLLGCELAEARRHALLPEKVNLICSAGLAERYARALGSFDVEAQIFDGEACALAGLGLTDADS